MKEDKIIAFLARWEGDAKDHRKVNEYKNRVCGILQMFLPDDTPTPSCPLTKREKEILILFSQGKKNRQIADVLFISYHTVRAHRASIFKKLNANGKFHAVRIAEKMGWIWKLFFRKGTCLPVVFELIIRIYFSSSFQLFISQFLLLLLAHFSGNNL